MTDEVDARIAQAEAAEVERHRQIDIVMEGWRPQGDKVVLATFDVLERKVGSIVTPGKDSPMGDKVERRGRLARVVAVGPDVQNVHVDDRVYSSSYSGAVLGVGDHSLLVISEADLLLVEVPKLQ